MNIRREIREIAVLNLFPFLKMQKMDFAQIFFLEIDLFDFHEFFGRNFFKFSGPLHRGVKK